MKLAFILDQLDTIKIYKDSSFAMMHEAASRGHQLFVMQQEDLAWKYGQVVGFSCALELTGQKGIGDKWYKKGGTEELPLQEFDVVLMRKDPPFDMEYIYSTYLLELAENQGARVINSPRGIRDHNEKFSIAKYSEFTPPTLVTRQQHLIRAFLNEYDDIVLKPLNGMGGASVFRVHNADQLRVPGSRDGYGRPAGNHNLDADHRARCHRTIRHATGRGSWTFHVWRSQSNPQRSGTTIEPAIQ